ncbi:MAG: SurA N-terminal domain-containing protein [Bacteroidales bacterium]
MATLENIRKRGPLVAVVIGFSLLMFILGDFINKGNSIFSGDRYSIARINDESINYQDFEKTVNQQIEAYKQNYGSDNLSESDRDRIREMIWESMIQKALLEEQYKLIGLTVSDVELGDLFKGKNIDPLVIRERAFANQQTGQFDPSMVVTYYKRMDEDKSGQLREYLVNLENQVKNNRMVRKYLNLISKGLYVPKQLVETEFSQRNYLVDFDFVAKLYTDVSDSAVSVTKDDLKKYYKEHKSEYEQKNTRDIAYVTFDVLPSAKDSTSTVNWIEKIKPEFKSTEDIKQFISFNSDKTFDPKHYKKGEISNVLVDSFMFSNEKGAVYGPYFEEGSFKLAKLVEISNLPDSLEAKHIIIPVNGQNISDLDKAKQLADSLKKVIEGGIDFAVVAKEYSADKTTLDVGGNLGWMKEGQEINGIPGFEPYKELLDKKVNEIVLVNKDYGVHIMVKTGEGPRTKKIQVGFLERKLVPSSETYQKIYGQASKFAGENRTLPKFEESIAKQGLIKRTAPGLTENGTFIAGLEGPRKVIRWAYTAKKGDVSEVFELGNRYVIASLTEIREEGIAPLEQVQDFVKAQVIKEKKAEILSKQMNEVAPGNISALAQALKANVQEAKNISFSSFQIPGMGFEPAVIAHAVTSEKDKLSKPIKGENGVYAISVKIITPSMNTEKIDLNIEKTRMISDLQNRIYGNPAYGDMGQVLNALKESADIKDERSKFY